MPAFTSQKSNKFQLLELNVDCACCVCVAFRIRNKSEVIQIAAIVQAPPTAPPCPSLSLGVEGTGDRPSHPQAPNLSTNREHGIMRW
jgi:hypothetical protein